jgi:hypothetical protein
MFTSTLQLNYVGRALQPVAPWIRNPKRRAIDRKHCAQALHIQEISKKLHQQTLGITKDGVGRRAVLGRARVPILRRCETATLGNHQISCNTCRVLPLMTL